MEEYTKKVCWTVEVDFLPWTVFVGGNTEDPSGDGGLSYKCDKGNVRKTFLEVKASTTATGQALPRCTESRDKKNVIHDTAESIAKIKTRDGQMKATWTRQVAGQREAQVARQ